MVLCPSSSAVRHSTRLLLLSPQHTNRRRQCPARRWDVTTGHGGCERVLHGKGGRAGPGMGESSPPWATPRAVTLEPA